jgi:hypothetical protein
MDGKIKLSPGELAEVKDSPFLLSAAEWLRVQRYVTNAMALPDNEARFRMRLEMPAEMKFDDFKQLLTGYATLVPHVSEWKKTTFPKTVELASDIVNYAGTVKTYCGGFSKFIDKLLTDPKDEAAARGLAAMVKVLADEAGKREKTAQDVYKAIQTFSSQTATDAVELDRLNGVYQQKFGATSAKGIELAKKLKDTHDLIESATREYEYDKAVACATPAYAWIVMPPFGLIAAIIVAGIYGDKAVKARQRLEDLKKDLDDLDGQQRFALMLTGMLSVARDGLAGIQSDIHAALPVIQKIEGAWASIHSDLAYLGTLITENIEQAIVEIKDMGVERVIDQWQSLKVTANAYRANAFIETPAGQ